VNWAPRSQHYQVQKTTCEIKRRRRMNCTCVKIGLSLKVIRIYYRCSIGSTAELSEGLHVDSGHYHSKCFFLYNCSLAVSVCLSVLFVQDIYLATVAYNVIPGGVFSGCSCLYERQWWCSRPPKYVDIVL